MWFRYKKSESYLEKCKITTISGLDSKTRVTGSYKSVSCNTLPCLSGVCVCVCVGVGGWVGDWLLLSREQMANTDHSNADS
jgi:hypothetical protein